MTARDAHVKRAQEAKDSGRLLIAAAMLNEVCACIPYTIYLNTAVINCAFLEKLSALLSMNSSIVMAAVALANIQEEKMCGSALTVDFPDRESVDKWLKDEPCMVFPASSESLHFTVFAVCCLL